MKNVINNELLKEQLGKFQDWFLTDFPAVLLLIVLLIISLKLIRIVLKRIKKTLLKHADKSEKVDTIEAEKRINTLMGILGSVIKIILTATFAMMILQKFGVNIAPILASAGILGLAIGFGGQELVRDVISGFFILLENQVRTGDSAIINGTPGTVETIQLRTITLRDFSGIVHIFQNGKINSLSNRTKEWSAAVFNIGVAYKENVQHVMNVMKQVGDELKQAPEFIEKIIDPIEIFGLDQFADSAIIIKARIKTRPSMQWLVTREYNKRLKEAFDNANIEIPFPHTTIYWGEKINPLQLDINEIKESLK